MSTEACLLLLARRRHVTSLSPAGEPAPAAEDSSPAVQTSVVEVRREGRVVAAADVASSTEPHGTAWVTVHSPDSDSPPDARAELVNKVMDRPSVSNSDSVHVVAPLGDSEALSQLQQRTTSFTARPAGSSSVIEADVARSTDDSY